MRSKKSQFYMITALFLSVLVLLATIRPTKTKPPAFDFSQLYENFISESKYGINTAIYQDRNISRYYGDFVDEFITYAGTQGADIMIFYAVAYDNKVVLGNRFGRGLNITTGKPTGMVNFILTDGNTTISDRPEWVNARIDGISYLFNTSLAKTQLKAVFRADFEDSTEVRTYG